MRNRGWTRWYQPARVDAYPPAAVEICLAPVAGFCYDRRPVRVNKIRGCLFC